TSRPRFGFGQQSTDPLAEPWAAQPRSAPAGSIFKPGNAVLVVAVDPAAHGGRVIAQQLGDCRGRPALARQQDHDQARSDAVGAVQQAGHVAGAAGGSGGASEGGVHAGGTHASDGLVGCLVGSSNTHEAMLCDADSTRAKLLWLACVGGAVCTGASTRATGGVDPP